MAREIERLPARVLDKKLKPGRHADGGGLYLVVDKSGAKRWAFLFRRAGKLREMGLGGASGVSLARARELAGEVRVVLAEGGDPVARRQAADAMNAAPRKPTFGEVADRVVNSAEQEWRNEKHRAQRRMTLTTYCEGIRDVPVDEITTDHVLKVLEQKVDDKTLWSARPETASRLRGRIERVLGAAKTLGLRSGENPALWRGHLKNLLPARQKLTRGHHAALPYADVSGFVADLRKRKAVAAMALEFTILTVARSGETLGATWGEIDLTAKIWTVPAKRMKAAREHRVPLTDQVIEVLDQAAKLRASAGRDAYVFPGQRAGRPLSGMSMEMLLRRANMKGGVDKETGEDRPDITVHGFRSAFRDWAGEVTSFPSEIAEAALAHVVGDATERAYRRGDALEKRRKLMEAWASYLADPSADNVIKLRA